MTKHGDTPDDCGLNPNNPTGRSYRAPPTTAPGPAVLIVQTPEVSTQPPAQLSDVGSLTFSHDHPDEIILEEEEQAYLNGVRTYDSDSI